jgi:hypothetical protein
MIKIKPIIEFDVECPVCKVKTTADNLVWQGIHSCVTSTCPECKRKLFSDLPIGQASMTPYTVCPKKREIFGEIGPAKKWFAKPLLKSLRKPKKSQVKVKITILKKYKKVIIVNCLDYLYGHCLLKLLNVDRHFKQKGIGVVVIIPPFLRWMVPKQVAEIWQVSLPLTEMLNYFPSLDQQISKQLSRFSQVYLSKSYSHPFDFSISTFTNQKIHEHNTSNFRISFIWREDRPWNDHLYASVLARKTNLLRPFISHQRKKVISLFKKIRKQIPQAELTVVGLGTSGKFPEWINDQRVAKFTPTIEKKLVKIYAESRVVLGVHGSNLLLPSAHAGGAISLIPDDRLGNFAQDILYQQPVPNSDPRLYAFFYRYLPISASIESLAKQVTSMVLSKEKVERIFTTR